MTCPVSYEASLGVRLVGLSAARCVGGARHGVEGKRTDRRGIARPESASWTAAGDGRNHRFGPRYSRVVDYAIAGVDGWTAIADPQFLTLFGDDAALALSGTSKALSFVTHSVSDTHGYAWFLNGESVRRIIYSQGEVVDEYGDALPEENDLIGSTRTSSSKLFGV